MSVLANTRSASSSGLTMEQSLPNEILREVFLYCDPATLYGSVRGLNSTWKHAVENQLIPCHFSNRDWRVGLRVVRKLPATHRGNQIEADDEIDRLNTLEREGALEPIEPAKLNRGTSQLVHVIPLQFQGYDAENISLRFSTGNEWHALFRVDLPASDDENDDDDDDDDDDDEDDHGASRARAEAKADSSRLELDFGLVWRFPDDGQDGDSDQAQKPNIDDVSSWGAPDPENGWLSRFYCSNFDVQRKTELEDMKGKRVLKSSPLARRVRRSMLHPELQSHLEDDTDDEKRPLVWSDEGHEYLSLDLSLGMEFFVRRSARANQLLRRLEAEAVAAEARDAMYASKKGRAGKGKRQAMASGLTSAINSGWATPREVFSPPPSRTTGAVDSRRRPQLLKLQQGQGSSSLRTSQGQTSVDKKAASKGMEPLEALDDEDLAFLMGQATPAGSSTPPCASMLASATWAASRLGSVAPSRRGGGSVALSSAGSSSSRNGSQGRTRSGCVPRATFAAKLCRAELMPSLSDTSMAVDAAGWTGGDKFGKGASRFSEPFSVEAHKLWPQAVEDGLSATTSDNGNPLQDALIRSGVTCPAVWSWSR